MHRLTPDTARALRDGRALAFLVDYRHPGLAEYPFTVVGSLDSLSFEGTLVPDDDPDCNLVRCDLPRDPCFVTETPLESVDARAVHQLWASRDGGLREDYLRFFDSLGSERVRARLKTALAATEVGGEVKRSSRTTAGERGRKSPKATRPGKGKRS